MFEAPPNVNGFSAAAGAAAPPKEKLGADVVAVEGFELPPNEKLGAADSCFVGSANLGVALKENEGAACVVVELEVPPKEKDGAAETVGLAGSEGFEEPPNENDGAASVFGAAEPAKEKDGADILGASSFFAALPNEKVGAGSDFFSSAFAPPKEKVGAARFCSSAALLPPVNEIAEAALDVGTDFSDVVSVAADVAPKEKEGAAASFFCSVALAPNENDGVVVLVSSVLGAPKENDGGAVFSSFFSVELGAPKENDGGGVFSSFFSVTLGAPKENDDGAVFSSFFTVELGAPKENDGGAVFSEVPGAPKANLGALAAGAAPDETFGALGFGSSQAGHLARSDALDIMQMEQVQFPLFALFVFAMKSANPPATGGGIGVAVSAGFGGAILGLGASQAGHLVRLASLDIIQMSQTHLFFAASFCFAIKSPNPPAAGARSFAGLSSFFGRSSFVRSFGLSSTSTFLLLFSSLPKNFFFCS